MRHRIGPRLAWSVVALLPFHALGQISPLDGKTIASVAYDPAKQALADEDLRRVQELTAGSKYSAKAVAESIDRMFATGVYADVQVEAAETAGGLAITFHTKAAPFVGHLAIRGKLSTPPNRGAVLGATQFHLGETYDPDTLAAAQHSIEKLFASNGLHQAKVRVTTTPDASTNLVNVTVEVNPGKRAHYEMPELKGDLKLPDATIRDALGWRVVLIHRWRAVTEALTQRGLENVRKKYSDHDRLEAKVDLADMNYDAAANREKATFQIDAGPTITVKALEAKVSRGDLKRLVPVYDEGAVDDDLLYEGARNLRDHFQAAGYPDVDVTFKVTPLENDQRTVEFLIALGARKRLAKLEIRGNQYFDTASLRERIYLLPASLRFRRGRYSDAFRTRDEQTIANLYRSNGFRDVKVTSQVTDKYKGKPDQIAVTYQIEEGPQWKIAKLETQGFEPADQGVLKQRIMSTEGQPYSEVNVETDRNLILDYYYRRGFPKASLAVTATEDRARHGVTLIYAMYAGPQEFVRDIVLLGLTQTDPKLVRRHLHVKPGDPLSLVDLDDSQRTLDDLGIFESVDTAIENPDGDETRKTVLYEFQQANHYTARFGVGAEIAQIGATTTDLSAPAGGTGFSPRFLLNVSRIDFLGLGHTISFDGRVSTLEQRAGVNYTIPNFLDSRARTITFSGLYDKASNVRTFTSQREEAAVQVSQKLSIPSTLLFRFAYRRVSTSNVVIPDLLIPQLVQPVRIGIFSINYAQDRRDNPLN
ncbi:MAG TPA: POTRA domain-containing protein, partial [Bryobacteraceae bacterium]|nr:POTRA domain-containing protein [Bryobacteraceae bacterium]